MTTPAVTPPAGMDFEQMAQQDAAKAQSNSGAVTAPTSTTVPAAGMDFEQMAQQDVAKSATTPPSSSGFNPDLTPEEYAALPKDQQAAFDQHVRAGRSILDPATGFLKGVGDTVNTLSGLLSRVAPSVVRPQDVNNLKSAYTATPGTLQPLGKVGESVAEFFLGDEALKGLSVAERLGLASKVAKLAESHPAIAQIIGHGLNAVRGGAVTTAQQLAHGATPTEALETGATAAGVGAGVGAVSEGVQALKPLAAEVVQGEKVAQTPAQAAMKTAAGATRETPLRESLTAPIEAAEKNADALYKQIDDASGTDFKGLGKKLKNANLKIRMSVNPTDEAAWEAKRSEIEDTLAEAKQTAADAGVDPKTLDQADAQFKKMSALTDVEKKVFKNVNVIDPTTGDVNVNAAVKELQKLQDSEKYGSSRLEQAGDEYTKLLEDMKAANRLGIKALKRQDLAKLLLKGTAAGAALVGGGHILHALGE